MHVLFSTMAYRFTCEERSSFSGTCLFLGSGAHYLLAPAFHVCACLQAAAAGTGSASALSSSAVPGMTGELVDAGKKRRRGSR